MKRLGLWLIAVAALIGSSFAPLQAQEDGRQLNILWIIAEDMGPDLGYFDVPQASTPNMDALAKESMVFTRAFSTAPICSISRSAFVTGMYATSIGAHQHRTPQARKQPLPEGVQLLTHRLEAAGYSTALLLGLAPQGEEEVYPGSAKTDWNFLPGRKPYQLDNLNSLKDQQPFFAQVQYQETHRGGHWDDASSMIERRADPRKVALPSYYQDTPLARGEWATYLDNVALFDRKVGYVMKRLRDEGVDKNTVVILFADHGRAMPRAKQWLWDSGLHVPLLIRWPEGYEPPENFAVGKTDQLVSLIDVTATTLQIAGIEPPLLMQGRPIFGAGAKPHTMLFAHRDRADETVDRIRTVRDERFRYIRNYMTERPYSQQNLYKETSYPMLREMFRMHRDGLLSGPPALFMQPTRPAEELYDTLADPDNVKNLAADPAYAQIRLRLAGALDAWIETSNDQGEIPEPPEVAEAINRQMTEKLHDEIAGIIAREGSWREDLAKP